MCELFIVIIVDTMVGMFSSHVRVLIKLVHASGIMLYIIHI